VSEEIFIIECIGCGKGVWYIRNENKEFKDCDNCGALNKRIYENNQRKPVEPIKQKSMLYRQIKSIIRGDENGSPFSFTYCEGKGKPLFTFTIEKKQEDLFIDENGQKWVKA
jgi:hypothetical protein